MTGPTTPENCPLCSQRLAEPTLDALERHFPDCIATETNNRGLPAPREQPPRRWGKRTPKRG